VFVQPRSAPRRCTVGALLRVVFGLGMDETSVRPLSCGRVGWCDHARRVNGDWRI
jgi:hypothetical protein